MASPDPHAPAGEDALVLAFAPVHKRYFGIAIGLVSGGLLWLVTLIFLVRGPSEGEGLWLLAQYFTGYTVSIGGAFVGLAWGFVAGFVAGWFFAFCRNLVVATSIFLIRAKAELTQTRDFLDHI